MENVLNKVKLSERLSQQVIPTNYKLCLNPNLKLGTFDGNVKIELEIKKIKSYINLHTKYLDIKDVTFTKEKEQISIMRFQEIKNIEQLLIQFKDPVQPGVYSLCIDFSGILTGHIGFYSSHIKDRFVFFLIGWFVEST